MGQEVRSGVMFAQSLVEYGALASIVAGVQHVADSALSWVATRPSAMWITVGAILVVWLVVRRWLATRL
jgi:hypothetical protein